MGPAFTSKLLAGFCPRNLSRPYGNEANFNYFGNGVAPGNHPLTPLQAHTAYFHGISHECFMNVISSSHANVWCASAPTLADSLHLQISYTNL
jgi:hypothetical protein